ncbi:MAG: TonB-dependent receptor [Nitrospirae bacterium]|nr:TonB-dependent receptor [Nitrospirota bacterium]
MREETVSIAVRHEQPISEAPSNVYVITDEDIRHSGATDIPTILRRIPGVEVMQTTGADFNVSVRGDNQLTANKLLVMVDGRSIYIDQAGVVFWKLLPVTLPEIKRIEVLKGPASAVYGFNAFDGVVNIITKSPEEMKGTTLQFGGGELGTLTSAAIHAGVKGNFGYRFSIGHDQNQQWRNRDAQAFNAIKVNAQTEYTWSDHSKLQVAGGVVGSKPYDGPDTAGGFQSDKPLKTYLSFVYDRADLSIRGWWNGLYTNSLNSIYSPLNTLERVTDPNGNQTNRLALNTYNLEASYVLRLLETLTLTSGANYRRNLSSSNFTTQHTSEDRLGLFTQAEWRALPSFSVVAGFRYDLDTFVNPTLSPRVAAIYTPAEGHTFRLSASVAYRPPTINEEALNVQARISLPGFSFTTPVLGSNGLQPERIVSYEAGYQGWFLRHRLRVRTDLFFNHISDLQQVRATGPAPTDPTTIINTGLADVYGGEAGAEYLATSWLSAFANYSYQEFGQSFTGFSRRGMPRFKWNAGLRGAWANGVNAELLYHYVGASTQPIADAFTQLGAFFPPGSTIPSERVGSYSLLNVRAGYRFWQDKAEFAVSAFNALNDKHREYPLGDEIGSRVMGWVTLKF